jgi:CubicO group peptidase (beta-lactamase class C family)
LPLSDPIDFPLHVTQTLGEPNPVSRRSMIKFLMQKGLNFTPGTAYKYSNVGFLVLGEVIEKKTGLSYENYVKQNILAPLGIYDVHLGKNLLADKRNAKASTLPIPLYVAFSLRNGATGSFGVRRCQC